MTFTGPYMLLFCNFSAVTNSRAPQNTLKKTNYFHITPSVA